MTPLERILLSRRLDEIFLEVINLEEKKKDANPRKLIQELKDDLRIGDASIT